MPHTADIVENNEKILNVYRQHWVNALPLILGWLVVLLLSIFGFYALGRYRTVVERIGPSIWVAVFLAMLMVLASLLLYAAYWVYRQNRLIITDKHLYQVTQNSLFNRRILQFGLERLQDVSASQAGFFSTAMDYGDVTVETAGEEENFAFHNAPQPRAIAHRIMECHRGAAEKHGVE